jgi:hypothetical protein
MGQSEIWKQRHNGHQAFLPALTHHHIAERDDGLFEILPDGAGPFRTRQSAHAVWLKHTRHRARWCEQ